MKIGGMGGLELVIILVVILLIFGPKNLPKLGKALGQTVSGLREGLGGDSGEDVAAPLEASGIESEAVDGTAETLGTEGSVTPPVRATTAKAAE